MRKLLQKTKYRKAFSLIELSIVILIISILISGAMSVMTSSHNKSNINVAHDNIKKIKEALEIYVRVNHKLPCPAPLIDIKAKTSTYAVAGGSDGSCSISGIYTSASQTNLVYGMAPVQTLNLSMDTSEDGSGNKIAYVVDKRFTDSSAFVGDILGSIQVKEAIDDTLTRNNTSEAIYLLISNGINQSGSFGVNSSIQNIAVGGDYETYNYAVPNNPTDVSAVFDSQFYVNDLSGDIFDDVIYYETRNNLIVSADAYDLIKCKAKTSELETNGTLHSWPETQYNHIATSTTACPVGWNETVAYPTRKCGVFGNWESTFTNPCTYSVSG